MNAVGTRHMFWSPPPRPFISNGPIRTIPLRMGGRPVLMGRSFLGQATPNRLDGVSIQAIIGRIQLAPTIQEYLKNPVPAPMFEQPYQRGRRQQTSPVPKFPPMTEAEKQILFEVSKNPSEEELKDLALIDEYFNTDFSPTFTTTAEVCYWASQPPGFFQMKSERYRGPAYRGPDPAEENLIWHLNPGRMERGGAWTGRQRGPKADISFLQDKFFCTDPKKEFGAEGFSAQFGIDTTKAWGETKLSTQNGITMLAVKKDYPWPPPIGTHPNFLWRRLLPLLPKIANIGMRLDPEAFKAWLTMATLEHYDSVTDEIIAYEKKKAKKKKRNAIIKAVAFAIAGLVLSFILPAILAAAVNAIKTAVELYIDVKERKKAAKALADAARMFREDAPKFADEVQKTADMMDSAAAQEQAAQPLTPEQLEAVQEVEAETPGTPTGTYVIGGVAATGLIAALVTLLR